MRRALVFRAKGPVDVFMGHHFLQVYWIRDLISCCPMPPASHCSAFLRWNVAVERVALVSYLNSLALVELVFLNIVNLA